MDCRKVCGPLNGYNPFLRFVELSPYMCVAIGTCFKPSSDAGV